MLFTWEKMCQDFLKIFEKNIFAAALARSETNARSRVTSHDADSKRRGSH